ncbi:hypothetical protein [Hymenobacter algoricola]|uniref:Alpha/beta hydrolase n=1 Tax=Hymenobacter algoricola TaxID=486267 RepID=A0ABP7MV81_9BACT
MRLFLRLLCVLLLSQLPSFLLAQAPDPLRQRLDAVFAPLDKSQVPTGRLAEYATPLLPLDSYPGTLADTNYTDMSAFRVLYATVQSARVYGQDTLPDLLAFNARLKAIGLTAPGTGPIPLAVQYVAYAAVRHEAFSQDLLRAQNEQLHDVPGRTQSPYQRQVLFAAAPQYMYSPTGAVSFVFHRRLYLASGSAAVQALYLDFDDGRGYVPAAWELPVSTSYPTAGHKHIRVKVVYNNSMSQPVRTGRIAPLPSEIRESHFDFEVLRTAPATRYSFDNTGGFEQNFDEVPSVHSGATISVRYGRGNGNEEIRKPLIIVEQYNIAGTAPSLIKCDNANNTVETFISKIGPDFTFPFDFDDKLELAGYDLIYIDFKYNLDYIQRNAAVFEEVVRWVNDKKQQVGSPEQNVVMGLSMGGLVARYGLARMEKAQPGSS